MELQVEHEDDTLVIRVPVTFWRRGGRKEIIVPEELPRSRPAQSAQEPSGLSLDELARELPMEWGSRG